MKINNPHFVASARAKITAHKAVVDAFLRNQKVQFVDAEAIRSAMPPEVAADLTDGVLSEIVRELGGRAEG
ncbi:hypothetical protein [Nitrosovibrio sp. Nv4]|uniref:hypothetical protein n=1 Tax=Nitrosovibrio sp. Nv4 TaxID=1945880 RepID=UPI000BCBA259|nr:hypothetical protein [Nitrosovibrio sp. Nv4]SOD41604.1 hypothetical protein SAMN06298226_1906 [Nitrosovibrio sp. Nv4]